MSIALKVCGHYLEAHTRRKNVRQMCACLGRSDFLSTQKKVDSCKKPVAVDTLN